MGPIFYSLSYSSIMFWITPWSFWTVLPFCFLPSYPMLPKNSSSAAFPSILINAFIKHFISFYLSLFAVNSSSKFVRTLRTQENTFPCTLSSSLCSVIFFSVFISDYGTSAWSWLLYVWSTHHSWPHQKHLRSPGPHHKPRAWRCNAL